MRVFRLPGLVAIAGIATSAAAEAPDAVAIHPPLAEYYSCAEHYAGQLPYRGDALGADCSMIKDGRIYKIDGTTNEDFHIWHQPVLAPFDGTVARVTINPVTNQPGTWGEPPASSVVFERSDGMMVMIGHLDVITVEEGDTVEAGQQFAVVGNNGMASSPHIHIGAWQGSTPLQVRFDLEAMARLRAPRDD